ncbi:uncharacterized protein LOC117320542 [Pecten maximus]|uniref:uncharacterized protein LOC117320542 n=1 Tax=Pecten maximus TaxID=6579 RepID=UPI0014580D85|nr:uncharacterized protein LOC117320542 [Pecten maximus]
MANSGLLITVCVLAVLACHVNAQCQQSVTCLNSLGLNISSISPSGGISGDFNVVCRNTSDVVHCYDLFTKCPSVAPFSSLLPGTSQMNTALSTICKNQNVLMQGFACLGLKNTFPTDLAACETKVQNEAGNLTPANIQGEVCSLMDSLLNCVTTMPSLRSCGTEFTNTVVSFEKELLPTSCPSGSPKLASWLFFTIMVTFMTSVFKRL